MEEFKKDKITSFSFHNKRINWGNLDQNLNSYEIKRRYC